jgi:hypothetical protein
MGTREAQDVLGIAGMLSATASLGMSYQWDPENGLSQIDKYTYGDNNNIKVTPLQPSFLADVADVVDSRRPPGWCLACSRYPLLRYLDGGRRCVRSLARCRGGRKQGVPGTTECRHPRVSSSTSRLAMNPLSLLIEPMQSRFGVLRDAELHSTRGTPASHQRGQRPQPTGRVGRFVPRIGLRRLV